MQFFKNQKLETIGKKEISRFLLHLIEKDKVSTSTQNQYNNAIKFYYKKVLGHNSSKTTERYTQVSTQEIGKIKNPLDEFYTK